MVSNPFNQSKRMMFIWLALPALLAVFLVTAPVSGRGGGWTEDLEMVGILLVIICVVGRCWSTLYIGSRKNEGLIRSGPYHFTRNPLYFFSTIGATGAGLMAESATLGIMAGVFSYVVFRYVIAREEVYLRQLFGADYDTYVATTPRFFPNPMDVVRARPSEEPVTFSPRALRRTFLDACVFLLVFPVMELIDWLQINGYLQPLIHLY